MTDPHDMSDEQVLARTLYGEISIGNREQKINVGSVILNRRDADLHGDEKPDWWGEGVKGVCLARLQFSCWNEGDPNRKRILAATEHSPGFAECLKLARGLLAGEVLDSVDGATHYHTIAKPKAAKAWPPSWAKDLAYITADGLHRFYRDNAAFY